MGSKGRNKCIIFLRNLSSHSLYDQITSSQRHSIIVSASGLEGHFD